MLTIGRWDYRSGKLKVFPPTYSSTALFQPKDKNERIKPGKKKKEKSTIIKKRISGSVNVRFVSRSILR